MAYAPPGQNITDTVGIFKWIGSVTNELFFPGLIFAVYIIILAKLMYNTNDLGKAFSSASFICMILVILLRTINLVNTTFMVIFIILTAVGAVWMHMENAKFG